MKNRIILISVFLVGIALPLSSQMPDWIPLKDRDGNVYFMDRAGVIHVTDEPSSPNRPVSAECVEYCYYLAVECRNAGNYTDSLKILKAIQCLGDSDERVRMYREKASADITRMMKTQGTRFEDMNRDAEPVLIRTGSGTRLVFAPLDYSFFYPGDLSVYRIRVRKDGRKILTGITLLGRTKTESQGYNCIIAIESEKDEVEWRSLNEVEENIRFRLGVEQYRFTEIRRDRRSVVRLFSGVAEEPAGGIECITYSGKTSHVIRVLMKNGGDRSAQDFMSEVIKGFRPVDR